MAEVMDDIVQDELETESENKEQSAESNAPPVEEKPVEDEIPERHRGKSMKQIIEELEHANKSMGKYANELGEVRRLADELIKSQLKPNETQPAKEVDFFENPQEAIKKQIESNPEVQAAKQYAMQAKQAQAKAEFQRRHPDYENVIKDEDFGRWVMASKVRQSLWQQAVAYDVDSADELFSTYKQLKTVKQVKLSEEEKVSRDKTLKAASVETGGSGESGKKIYRRADLINLKLRDPRKFSAMQDEIDAAYREGRVK